MITLLIQPNFFFRFYPIPRVGEVSGLPQWAPGELLLSGVKGILQDFVVQFKGSC
jgi:hypothetical protein